jgi:hypothetical protein
MIETSIQKHGFGRSILVANDGTIIAGNATIEAAAAAGIEKVRYVESRGDEVIAVKRVDVEPDTREFHELAVGDNRSGELADGWIGPVLASLDEKYPGLREEFFYDDEWDAALAAIPDVEFKEYDESVADDVQYAECPSCGHRFPK